MTKYKKKHSLALERRFTGHNDATWHIAITGTMPGTSAEVKRRIFAAIEKHAHALPGVVLLRVTAFVRTAPVVKIPTPVKEAK